MQKWGFLVGPSDWDPVVTISLNALGDHNLTYTFDGRARKDLLYLPALLTADISGMTSMIGSWEVWVRLFIHLPACSRCFAVHRLKTSDHGKATLAAHAMPLHKA